MQLIGILIGGLISGSVGAGIWAAIAYFADMEIGWAAWGVGVLVGIGVRAGARGSEGVGPGVVAAVIALASVAGGKYWAVHLVMEKELTKMGVTDAQLAARLDDDQAIIAYITEGLIEEQESQGKAVKWPEGVDPEDAQDEADYPKEIWADAAERWKGMDNGERANFRESVKIALISSFHEAKAGIRAEGFSSSFGLFDLLWFGLAVVSAFKIGSGAEAQSAE